MVRRLLSDIWEDSAARLRLQTKLLSIAMASIFGIIGGGFLFAPSRASAAPATYQLIVNVEGNLQVHGAVMMALGGFVLYTSSEYRRLSKLALALMMFYAFATGLLILGSWWLAKVSFPAPMWYFLVGVICFILVRVSPTVGQDRSLRGERSARA